MRAVRSGGDIGRIIGGSKTLPSNYQGITSAKSQYRSPQRPNQALERTRDSVLRYGEPVGRELLNFFVMRKS